MMLSIFTDELGLEFAEALPILASLDYAHCDLRGRIFGQPFEKLTADDLAKVRRLLGDHNMRVAALQSSLAKVHLPDAARRKAEQEKLEAVIRAADALDCRLVRVFNYWQPPPEQRGALAEQSQQLQAVLEAFGPISRRAQQAGLVLAFENCGQTPEEVFALLDALDVPAWGLAWDCHNHWAGPERQRDETAYIDTCLKRARMVHVKAMSIVPELGGEILPWDRILAACAACGMEGPVSVETHNPAASGFGNNEMSQRTTEAIRSAWNAAGARPGLRSSD